MAESTEIVWMEDEASDFCLVCEEGFTFFTRRHHCRACGELVCSTCSKTRMDLPWLNRFHVRVCDPCVISGGRKKLRDEGSKNRVRDGYKPGTPSIPSTWRDKIEAVVDKTMRVAADDHLKEWQKLGKKKSVDYYCRSNENETCAQLARGIVQVPSRLWFDMVQNRELAKRLEPMIHRFEDIEKIDQHNQIFHMIMKPIWPTAARDICLFDHWRVLEDGTIVIAQFSVSTDKAPEGIEGRVRAWQEGGGIVIEPLEDSPLVSNITYFIDLDLKLGENIPGWVIRKVNELNASMLANGIVNMELEAKKLICTGYLEKPFHINANGSYEVSSSSRNTSFSTKQEKSSPPQTKINIYYFALLLLALSTGYFFFTSRFTASSQQ